MGKKEFLYERVYSRIKASIIEGKYLYHETIPSERALSEQFGVWRATVRQALDMLCSEGLVERAVGVGTRVIYMAGGKEPELNGNVIGFFIADDEGHSRPIAQPYYSDLMYWLNYECQEKKCRVIYATINSKEEVADILLRNDFLFIAFLVHSNFEYLKIVRSMGIPVALVNERYQDYPTISCDHTTSGYIAVKYLLEKGHRNIGIITGPPEHMSSQDKLAGCYRAMAEYDVPLPRGATHQIGNWEYDGGYECARRIFADTTEEKRPTAIFAFNDAMCVGAVQGIESVGLKIPKDVSVIGNDNMEQLNYYSLNLTTVDLGIRYIAKTIVDYALARDYINFNMGTKILTPVSLVERESVLNLSPKK